MSAPAPETRRPVGTFRLLFPFVVIALGAVAWYVAHTWPNTDVDSSSLSMAKMLTFLVVGALLFLWALRMPWRKRYVLLGLVGAVAVTFAFVRYDGMWGNFLPMFVARDWVQDAFLGGSPDTLLEQHRRSQGKSDGVAELTEKPGDFPAYRGANRDGIMTGPTIS